MIVRQSVLEGKPFFQRQTEHISYPKDGQIRITRQFYERDGTSAGPIELKISYLDEAPELAEFSPAYYGFVGITSPSDARLSSVWLVAAGIMMMALAVVLKRKTNVVS